MNQNEKELLLQLLLEKYNKSQSKGKTTSINVVEIKKHRAKHARQNKDRMNWTPELKTALLEWHQAGMPIESFAQTAGIRKTQAVSMLYDITRRNPIAVNN